MKIYWRKFMNAAATDGAADPTAQIIKAIDEKFVGVVKQDALDKAIAGAATVDQVKALTEEVTITKELAGKLNEKLGQIQTTSEAKVSWTSAVSKAITEQISDIRQAMSKRGSNIKLETKAAATMDFTNNFPTADSYITDVRSGIIGLPNRRVHARQLLPNGSTSQNIFAYVKETGGEGAPAFWSGYTSAKPKIDRDFVETDAPVRDIAGYLKITRRMLDDTEGLQSFLQNRLAEMYLDAEDNAILYGANNTAPNLEGLTVAATGAVSGAARTIDKMVLTKAAMEANNYYPNAIVTDPVTWHEMLLSSFASAGYSYPVIFNGANNSLTLAGIPVISHQEIVAGNFLMGDFANGAQLIVRQQPTIEFANQNEDDFIKNLIVIRIEGRIALPIYHPAAFAYGAKGTFSGS